MADYAGHDVTWLGQTFHVGRFTGGDANWDVAIQDDASAFVLLSFCKDVIGIYDENEQLKTEGFAYIDDGAGNIKFALGFKYNTHSNGLGMDRYYCWWKLADANTTITEGETPPDFAPWNSWIYCGASHSYGGLTPELFEDMSSLPIEELTYHLAMNSITFFAPDKALFPYNWDVYSVASADDMMGYSDSQFVICTTGVQRLTADNWPDGWGYDGATPLHIRNEGVSHWFPGGYWATPNYALNTTIGVGDIYRGYCPLDFGGVILPDDPEEDMPDDKVPPGGGNGGIVPGGWGGVTGHDRTLPQKEVSDTGLISIFAPTDNQVHDLASYLWTTDYHDSCEKWGLKPMEQIINFGFVPFIIPHEQVSTTVHMCGQATPVDMFKATHQYHIFNCGSVYIKGPNNDNVAAYSDYQRSKALMYVPAIGFVPLVATDILDRTLELEYKIDIFTGDIVANVYVSRSAGNFVGSMENSENVIQLSSYTGNCFTNYPLTEANYAQYYQQKRNAIFGLLGDLAGGLFETGGSLATGNPAGVVGGILNTVTSIFDGIDNMTKLAPEVNRSGSMEASLASLSREQPFVMLVTPHPYIDKAYIQSYGYATSTAAKIKDLGSGFTVVARLEDKVAGATVEEQQMIESILKDGFFI